MPSVYLTVDAENEKEKENYENNLEESRKNARQMITGEGMN